MNSSKLSSTLLNPPEQFGMVEPGIFRSEMLQPVHFPFIKQFGFQTVVMLSPELPNCVTTNLIEEGGIQLVRSTVSTEDNSVCLLSCIFFFVGKKIGSPRYGYLETNTTFNLASSIRGVDQRRLRVDLNVKTHPVLIMCTSGIHETGTLVGCLRKLECWNFSSIVTEYRSFAGSKARYVNEQFIELFDLDLVTLPKDLPAWFLHQREMLALEENSNISDLGQVNER
ncbi:unnamed protein product [Absidia cylindrospora]